MLWSLPDCGSSPWFYRHLVARDPPGSHWLVDTCCLNVVYRPVAQPDIWALVDPFPWSHHSVPGRLITDKYLEHFHGILRFLPLNLHTIMHGCNLGLTSKAWSFQEISILTANTPVVLQRLALQSVPHFSIGWYSQPNKLRGVSDSKFFYEALAWPFRLSLYVIIVMFVPKNSSRGQVRRSHPSSMWPKLWNSSGLRNNPSSRPILRTSRGRRMCAASECNHSGQLTTKKQDAKWKVWEIVLSVR